ncbi:MAG: hypothetical protein AAF871_06675 [Pseudomonadota bacterium]
MEQSDDLIADLIALDTIKTWSLIVTLFGDYQGTRLSGKDIRTFLEPLDLKPEAIRVALHRLKRDGWIGSAKSGREVQYSLTKKGRTETMASYSDVYRQDAKYPNGWHVFLFDHDDDRRRIGTNSIHLGPNLYLAPETSETPSAGHLTLSLETDLLPLWVQKRIVGEDTLKIAEDLLRMAHRFECELNGASELRIALVRMLFLHHWRKMALRPACWAHVSLVPDGPIAGCHKEITEILAQTQHLDPRTATG